MNRAVLLPAPRPSAARKPLALRSGHLTGPVAERHASWDAHRELGWAESFGRSGVFGRWLHLNAVPSETPKAGTSNAETLRADAHRE
jgi:hypothetical protein